MAYERKYALFTIVWEEQMSMRNSVGENEPANRLEGYRNRKLSREKKDQHISKTDYKDVVLT